MWHIHQSFGSPMQTSSLNQRERRKRKHLYLFMDKYGLTQRECQDIESGHFPPPGSGCCGCGCGSCRYFSYAMDHAYSDERSAQRSEPSQPKQRQQSSERHDEQHQQNASQKSYAKRQRLRQRNERDAESSSDEEPAANRTQKHQPTRDEMAKAREKHHDEIVREKEEKALLLQRQNKKKSRREAARAQREAWLKATSSLASAISVTPPAVEPQPSKALPSKSGSSATGHSEADHNRYLDTHEEEVCLSTSSLSGTDQEQPREKKPKHYRPVSPLFSGTARDRPCPREDKVSAAGSLSSQSRVKALTALFEGLSGGSEEPAPQQPRHEDAPAVAKPKPALYVTPKPAVPTNCCGGGCKRCVWDEYYDQLAAWRRENAAALSKEDLGTSAYPQSPYHGTVEVQLLGTADKVPDVPEYELVRDHELHMQYYDLLPIRVRPNSDASSMFSVFIDVPESQEPSECAKETWRPGDALEIFMPNPEGSTVSLLRRLNIDPNEVVVLRESKLCAEKKLQFPPWLPRGVKLTALTLMRLFVDIRTKAAVQPTTLAMVAAHAAEEAEKKRIHDVLTSGPDGRLDRATYEARILGQMPTLLDVLVAFPSSMPPLGAVLEVCGQIKPRKYSLACVPEFAKSIRGPTLAKKAKLTMEIAFRYVLTPRPTATDETVVKILMDSDGNDVTALRMCGERIPRREFHGHVTHRLAGLVPPQFKTSCMRALAKYGSAAWVRAPWHVSQGTFASKLPPLLDASDGARRLVLVAAGAGIAPMRAIIQHRLEKAKTQCGIHLIYGVRSIHDFVFQAEWEVWEAAGLVLTLALSGRHDAAAAAKLIGFVPHSAESEQRQIRFKHVTDALTEQPALLASTMQSGGAIVVCGPDATQRAVRALVGKLLFEPVWRQQGQKETDANSFIEAKMRALEDVGGFMCDSWNFTEL